MLRSRPGVVAMSMGDDGPADRLPGIDVKITQRAIQPALCERQQVRARHAALYASGKGLLRQLQHGLTPPILTFAVRTSHFDAQRPLASRPPLPTLSPA